MKNNIKGIPYSTAEFDKEGKPLTQPTVPADSTDLIFISHGWNNDRNEAEELYRKLFENLADVTANDPEIKKRKIAIIGVIWPAKKFNEFMSQPPAGSKVVGGAASVGGGEDKAASEAAMLAAIDRAAPLFDDKGDNERVAALRKLVPKLEDDTEAQRQFVETFRTLLDPDGSKACDEPKEDAAAVFFRASAETIFQNAAQPSAITSSTPSADSKGPEDGIGRAAGIGSFFSGAANAVSNLLNLTTYYEMKQRAGIVGKNGLAPLIDNLADQVSRIHLIGHSFGG
ncbi:MAG: hypothetical protein ABIR84_05855 [Candidatus Nitrotoga sp.]